MNDHSILCDIKKNPIQLSTFNIIFGYIIGYMEDFSTLNIYTKYNNYVYRRSCSRFSTIYEIQSNITSHYLY